MPYCQLVMGPAGSGKSTYCETIRGYCEAAKRTVHVVNLDPAAENFEYPVTWDIRDIISVDDVTESLNFGPNGGLIYCMEYLVANLEVLEDLIGDSDDYYIFDLPGQIELYTHIPVMKQLIDFLVSNDFKVVGVYLIDSQFLDDPAKFFSGILSAIATMVNLEIPHINVMSKMDLAINPQVKKEIDSYLDPDTRLILSSVNYHTRKAQQGLNEAIAGLIDEYSLVRFVPLDRTDEDSIADVLAHVDMSIQYGEDLEVKEAPDDDQDDERIQPAPGT